MIYFTTLLLSMFITIVLIPILKGMAVRVNAVDIPNSRKVHTKPIPRIGGVAMAIGTLVPILLWFPGSPMIRAIFIGAAIIVFSGAVDDIKQLGYKAKFAGQVIAALVIILYGGITINNLGVLMPDGYLLPKAISIGLTLLVIVGVTNAINLSDGLDGLAGGITLLTFICIAYLAFRCENLAIAISAVAAAGAIFGFLRYNTHPAVIFMGDAGSQFLGFLAIVLPVALTQENTPLSPFLPLIILGFPILDTVTVMTERIADGRSPFVADKKPLPPHTDAGGHVSHRGGVYDLCPADTAGHYGHRISVLFGLVVHIRLRGVCLNSCGRLCLCRKNRLENQTVPADRYWHKRATQTVKREKHPHPVLVFCVAIRIAVAGDHDLFRPCIFTRLFFDHRAAAYRSIDRCVVSKTGVDHRHPPIIHLSAGTLFAVFQSDGPGGILSDRVREAAVYRLFRRCGLFCRDDPKIDPETKRI